MVGINNFQCPNCKKLNDVANATCWNCGNDFLKPKSPVSKLKTLAYISYVILLILFAHKLKVIAEQVGFITILLLPIIINIYKKLKNDSIEYESNKDIIKLGYKYIDENCEIKD